MPKGAGEGRGFDVNIYIQGLEEVSKAVNSLSQAISNLNQDFGSLNNVVGQLKKSAEKISQSFAALSGYHTDFAKLNQEIQSILGEASAAAQKSAEADVAAFEIKQKTRKKEAIATAKAIAQIKQYQNQQKAAADIVKQAVTEELKVKSKAQKAAIDISKRASIEEIRTKETAERIKLETAKKAAAEEIKTAGYQERKKAELAHKIALEITKTQEWLKKARIQAAQKEALEEIKLKNRLLYAEVQRSRKEKENLERQKQQWGDYVSYLDRLTRQTLSRVHAGIPSLKLFGKQFQFPALANVQSLREARKTYEYISSILMRKGPTLLKQAVTDEQVKQLRAFLDQYRQLGSVVEREVSPRLSLMQRYFQKGLPLMNNFTVTVADLSARVKAAGRNLFYLVVQVGMIFYPMKKLLDVGRSFEKELLMIQSMLPETINAAEALGETIWNVARAFGFSAEEVARATYDLLSARYTVAETQTILMNVAQYARIMGADLQTTMSAVITIMQAYNFTAAESARVSELLYLTIQQGRGTLNDLVSSLGRVVEIAAAAGVSIEELLAAYATISRVLPMAEQNITSITRLLEMFTGAAQEGVERFSKALTLFREDVSITFRPTFIQAKGLLGVLQELSKLSLPELKELFPEKRAFRGLIILMRNLEDYAEILKVLEEEHPVLNKQFEQLSTNAELLGSIIDVELRKIFYEVFQTFKERILAVLIVFKNFLLELDRLIKTTPQLIKDIVMFGAQLAAAAGMIILTAEALNILIGALQTLQLLISLASGNIPLFVAGLVMAGAAVGGSVYAFKKFKREVNEIGDVISNIRNQTIEDMKDFQVAVSKATELGARAAEDNLEDLTIAAESLLNILGELFKDWSRRAVEALDDLFFDPAKANFKILREYLVSLANSAVEYLDYLREEERKQIESMIRSLQRILETQIIAEFISWISKLRETFASSSEQMIDDLCEIRAEIRANTLELQGFYSEALIYTREWELAEKHRQRTAIKLTKEQMETLREMVEILGQEVPELAEIRIEPKLDFEEFERLISHTNLFVEKLTEIQSNQVRKTVQPFFDYIETQWDEFLKRIRATPQYKKMMVEAFKMAKEQADSWFDLFRAYVQYMRAYENEYFGNLQQSVKRLKTLLSMKPPEDLEAYFQEINQLLQYIIRLDKEFGVLSEQERETLGIAIQQFISLRSGVTSVNSQLEEMRRLYTELKGQTEELKLVELMRETQETAKNARDELIDLLGRTTDYIDEIRKAETTTDAWVSNVRKLYDELDRLGQQQTEEANRRRQEIEAILKTMPGKGFVEQWKQFGAMRTVIASMWWELSQNFKDTFEATVVTMTTTLISSMREAISNMLYDWVTGLKTMEDFWKGVWQSMVRMAANLIAEFVMRKAFAGIFTMFGIPLPGLQEGGIVTRPTLAMVGERGPEAVIPLNSPEVNVGSDITIVNAITPEAIANSLTAHPEVVVNIVSSDILREGPTLRVLKRKVS